MLDRLRRMRTVALAVVLFIFIDLRRRRKKSLVYRLRNFLHMHRFLLKLPTIDPKAHPEYVHPIFGNFGSSLLLDKWYPAPKEEAHLSATRRVQSALLPALFKASQLPEIRDEGIMCLWAIGPKPRAWIPNNMCTVFVFGMDNVREVLANKSMDLYNKGFSYDASRCLIGDGLLGTSGPKWARQRRVIEKGFKHDLVSRSMPKVLDTASELIDKWEAELDLKSDAGDQSTIIVAAHEEMMKLTLDVLGHVAFSTRFNSVVAPTTHDAPFYHAFEGILEILAMRCYAPLLHDTRHLPTPQNLRLNKCMEKINGAVRSVIKERVSTWNDPPPTTTSAAASTPVGGNATSVPSRAEQPRDLLDIMLASSDLCVDDKLNATELAQMASDAEAKAYEGDSEEEEGVGADTDEGGDKTTAKMTFANVFDSMRTLLFAGHDTTGALATWMLHLLASPKYSHVTEMLVAEIDGRFGRDGDPSYDDLEDLPVLNACLKESLRLFPSACFTRKPKQDVTIGRHTVPAGAEVVLVPFITQRDEKVYERANEFVPERWLPGGDNYTVPRKLSSGSIRRKGRLSRADSLQTELGVESMNSSYYPFSLGRRNCVGRPLALMEVRVVILKLMQRFEFDVADDPDFREFPVFTLTLNPASVKLKVKRRAAVA
jgi:cytochrome P450